MTSLYNGRVRRAQDVALGARHRDEQSTRGDLRKHKLAAPYSPFDLVFATPEGTPMDPANLRHRVFADTLTRAKLRKIRIHDLRHTFASLLINQGENVKYVQSQLGTRQSRRLSTATGT